MNMGGEDGELERTLWCGNLHENVTDELLYEIFIQAGPLDKVRIAGDKGKKKPFAFITFKHSASVPYTIQLMNGIRLFNKSVKLQVRPGSKHDMSRGHSQGTPVNTQPHAPGSNVSPLMQGQTVPGLSGFPSESFHRSYSAPGELALLQQYDQRRRASSPRSGQNSPSTVQGSYASNSQWQQQSHTRNRIDHLHMDDRRGTRRSRMDQLNSQHQQLNIYNQHMAMAMDFMGTSGNKAPPVGSSSRWSGQPKYQRRY